VKRWLFASIAVVIAALLQSAHMASVTLLPAQQPQQIQNTNVPRIPFESVPEYFKYSAQMNLGEVLGVAVNSKGRVVILNHPGSATSGPLYGNATTQLLEFDEAGKFAREIGHGFTASVTPTVCASTSTTTCGSSTRGRIPSCGSIRRVRHPEPWTAARRGG
jgi:hypothetical protein